MNQKIVFNGNTYDSLDQMPPMERQAYEALMGAFADKDGNGTPDLLEGGTIMNVQSSQSRIFFEGKLYKSVEELPPEAQTRYRATMGRLDADGNGIPDLVEERLGMRAIAGSDTGSEHSGSLPDWLKPSETEGSNQVFNSSSSPAIHSSQNIKPEGINWRTAITSALLIGLVCLGAVTLWFYLAQ